MGLLHRDYAHWSSQQIISCRCHFIGSAIRFRGPRASSATSLRILFEDLRVGLAKHLRYPLVSYSSGTQPCGVCGAKIVDSKVGNFCSSKSSSPNSLKRRLVPARNPIARKQKRPFTRNRHITLECFDGERSERNLGLASCVFSGRTGGVE